MIKGGYKMRMLMNVKIPHEPFNTLVKEGRAGEIITPASEPPIPAPRPLTSAP
jgi:hypothetical protein